MYFAMRSPLGKVNVGRGARLSGLRLAPALSLTLLERKCL